MARKISVSDKTKVHLKSCWKHIDAQTAVFIEPYTPMSQIIEKLEKTINIKYTPLQTWELKQYYQKTGTIKRKTTMGWWIEYLINGKYVPLNELHQEDYSLPTSYTFIHQSFPLIKPVQLNKIKTVSQIAAELNAKIESFKLDSFLRTKKNELETISKITDRHYQLWKGTDYAKKLFVFLENLGLGRHKKITPDHIIKLFINQNESKPIFGWWILKSQINTKVT